MNTTPGNDNATGQGREGVTANQSTLDSSYPQHKTQPARLLAVLLNRGRVNPLKGWRNLGIYRLSDTVYQLRRRGWPVETGHLDVENRFAEVCHVAEYFLPHEAIKKAGDHGSNYASQEFDLMDRRGVA